MGRLTTSLSYAFGVTLTLSNTLSISSTEFVIAIPNNI